MKDNKLDIKYAINRSMRMLNDRETSNLGDMFSWMDNAFHSYWELPKEVQATEWVHRVTSTDPHDAIRAGTRTLSTVMPKVQLQPTFDNEETRKTTAQVERALMWIFQQATKRRSVSLLRDIVLSALLYDEVIITTWYLPYQEKLMREIGGQADRLAQARKHGDYILKVLNPQNCIVEYSDLQAERVLTRTVYTVQEAIDMWGNVSSRLYDYLDPDTHRYVTIYDYHEIGHRSVFAYLQEDAIGFQTLSYEGAIELVNEETPYKFLPYAAKVGGTTLSDVEEYRRIPLLWSLYNSGQWETQNIVETLLASEGLAYSVSPRYAVENEFDSEPAQLNFRDPARIIHLKRGQRLTDLRPPQLNQGLEILSDRISARIDKSTVPRVLQSGDYPAGSAFSSLNLATQSGMKSLAPYKELAEQALVDMFSTILYWIDFTGDKVTTFPEKTVTKKADIDGSPVNDVGVDVIEIDNSYFDVNHLYLQVRLTEDVPTDFVARVNSAAMLVERLQGSYYKALELTGENDPESVMRLREQENLRLAENQAAVTKIVNETSLDFMDMQRQLRQKLSELEQMQAMLEQQQQEAQAGAGPGGQNPGMQPEGVGGPSGMTNQEKALLAARRGNSNQGVFPGGEGANPAGGGMPGVQAAPGVGLREQIQGEEGEG